MSKMWAAFFLSVLLVSTLNFYAVVREPDRIEIDEVHEHLSETVKIEGTLISWVRDPYSDGSDRVDRIQSGFLSCGEWTHCTRLGTACPARRTVRGE